MRRNARTDAPILADRCDRARSVQLALPVVSDLPEIALAAVEVLCESRVPEQHRHEIRLGCTRRGHTITILERRAPWNPELIGPDWTSLEIAQLRFDQSSGRWSLYCRDRNEQWCPYENIGTSASIGPLLAEIDADPTGIFWG